MRSPLPGHSKRSDSVHTAHHVAARDCGLSFLQAAHSVGVAEHCDRLLEAGEIGSADQHHSWPAVARDDNPFVLLLDAIDVLGEVSHSKDVIVQKLRERVRILFDLQPQLEMIFIGEVLARHVPRIAAEGDLAHRVHAQERNESPVRFAAHLGVGNDALAGDDEALGGAGQAGCSANGCEGRINPTQQTEGFADDFSWGLRSLVQLNYSNLFDVGLTVKPTVLAFWDVEGISPSPMQNYVEGNRWIIPSLFFEYGSAITGTLIYQYFAGSRNALADRDNISFSLTYAF